MPGSPGARLALPVVAPAVQALAIPREPGRKLLVLESIRGIAALAVFNFHFIDLLARQVWEAPLGAMFTSTLGVAFAVAQVTPLNALVNSELAVRTFFVLSGFVLSWKYCTEGKDEILRAAAVKRCVRLGIPIAASLVVAFVVFRVCSSHEALLQMEVIEDQAMIRQDVAYYPPTWVDVVKQSIKAMFLGVDHRTLNRALWTMQHELLGSYVVFCFLILFGRMKQRWAVYAIAAGVALLVWRPYVIDFLVGMALSELTARVQSDERVVRRLRSWALAAAAAGVGFMMAWYPLQKHVWEGGAFFVVAPAFAAGLLVFGALFSPAMQSALCFRPFVFFGRISFGSYLLHLPVIYGIGGWIFYWSFAASGSYTGSFITGYVVSLLALLFIADVFTRYVDAPTIALTQRLATAVGPRPRADLSGSETRDALPNRGGTDQSR